MQHKIKLLNKEQDWSRLKNYRPNEVVNHNGKQWQNITGLNSEPSNSNFDWVNIDFNNTDNALLKPEEDGNLDDFPDVVGVNRDGDTAFLSANSFGKVKTVNGQEPDENGDIPLDLDYIPLSGTAEGKSITGTLKVDESIDTLFQVGDYEIEPSPEYPIGRGAIGKLSINKKYYSYKSAGITDNGSHVIDFSVGIDPRTNIPKIISTYVDLDAQRSIGYIFELLLGTRTLLLQTDLIDVDKDFTDLATENKTVLAQRSYVDAMQTKPTNWTNASQRFSGLLDKSADATYDKVMVLDSEGKAGTKDAGDLVTKEFADTNYINKTATAGVPTKLFGLNESDDTVNVETTHYSVVNFSEVEPTILELEAFNSDEVQYPNLSKYYKKLGNRWFEFIGVEKL